MYLPDQTTSDVKDVPLTQPHYKRLVDYENRPFINPNFKWLIACVPIATVIILMICLRIRKSRMANKGAAPPSESEYVDEAPESEPTVHQGDGLDGPETRSNGSFGQTLPLWNIRSSSLSPIHALPPPAYVRYSPDPPKYEDIIGSDDVPLAHCQSRLLGLTG
ncbi:hypothetical protein K450DRAFT_271473 [Umbelopsis ramanniana AG]|uniref:Uncharacterized protein n=1 Tax=Umbelopsis ramanniana AG TaxID=1314678 RepID=A0AAD5E9N0_UMBRA|nr:uncharacterized protein K450DRAFT_271473 [Umbelopsis ramanniana AG]KAI8579891.1 hypothetical protein K450DRAFT_271473 [Umbelopsis ramanniana AG]